ncbi:MAG: NAD(P)/FAD-dependent oxidoreductase [Peptococcaceae bacterium]|nr:NAD(P)/FAD-dependent oxidoreductase [Peptococcaceae bacterium]
MTRDIIVAGGGAAGVLAAGRAAQMGARVWLMEKNRLLGCKLRITGKGRCNVTNAGELEQFIENYSGAGRFLYSAFHRFFNLELCRLLESYSVPLKTERGGRVFPASDRAADVAEALEKYAVTQGVQVLTSTEVSALSLSPEGGINGVRAGGRFWPADAVVLATGGLSYPATGCTGDGYRWAGTLGHHVTELRPALVPLEIREPWPGALSGLALKNVEAGLWEGARCLRRAFGEMLFARFGVTGPIILLLSRDVPEKPAGALTLKLDLKPALSEEVLDRRLLRDLLKFQRRQMKNALRELLPKALIPVVLRHSGIPEDVFADQLTKAQRQALVHTLKGLPMTVSGTRPVAEAVVTRGGVSLKEVNPRTMASRITPGLYFAGEVLDIDGRTGGYNLQAAFSTGWLAGESAARGPG